MATILLVEDEPMLADCYARWLRAAGHVVHHVPDGYAAVDALDSLQPQAIVLDLLLPGANGLQLLQTMQSYPDLQHIPVVICSNALPQTVPDMAPYGVKKVLEKTTLTRPRLCIAVAEVL